MGWYSAEAWVHRGTDNQPLGKELIGRRSIGECAAKCQQVGLTIIFDGKNLCFAAAV